MSPRAYTSIPAAAAAVILLGSGCSTENAPDAKSPRGSMWSHSPPVCGVDEVREYRCEELLPREHALSAPEPYDACPASVETQDGVHEPTPPVALFDADYTEHIRRRMPPGHSCCYSWVRAGPGGQA